MFLRSGLSLINFGGIRPVRSLCPILIRAKSTLPASASEENELTQGLKELSFEEQIPYARSKIGHFFQKSPELGNQFLEDVTLRKYLKRFMPDEVLNEITPDLERFGHRVATDLYRLSLECEHNQPQLEQYDAWGKRVDNIITCNAWKQMKSIAAEEGLISIAYERKYAEWSRLYQVVKLYLYAPSSGLFSCPLAMTDGAARSLEVFADPYLQDQAYTRVISRDPARFWTSGQWMTERKGGSDVANGTETLAVPEPDGSYRLYGYKWFTSATDADMTLTLARIVGRNGEVIEGTRGVSMFYLQVRDEDGNLNNIEIQKLKEKLGTRQLPTAEMLLDGVRAYKIADEGRGVASIATMLTLTRTHNSLSAASGMRRVINLARDWSTKRECFKRIIKDHPLHIQNMANMEIEARSALLLTLELARLMGREDCNLATEHEQAIFRLLTPVCKLYTAKQAVAVASEGLECFGGLGYMEDTNLPVLLRDAQVLPIWEGTTNILSLDVLRAIAKSRGGVLKAFHKDISERLSVVKQYPELQDCAAKVKKASDDIVSFASTHTDKLELAARDFAFSIARTYMGMLLTEHACWSESTPQDVLAAKRWCDRDLAVIQSNLLSGCYEASTNATEFNMVYDGYHPNK